MFLEGHLKEIYSLNFSPNGCEKEKTYLEDLLKPFTVIGSKFDN